MRLLLLPTLLIAGCTSGPVPPPPVVPGPTPDPPVDEPFDPADYSLGRVDGRPVPEGSSLSLRSLTVDCAPGPDPSLDNEHPAAQADERWMISLETRGWASVTHGVRAFLWDGAPDAGTDLHRLAYRAGVSMRQIPSEQSADPYEYDAWRQAIPVLSDPVAADGVSGTTLPCSDEAGLAAARHDLMVCAQDARDLETVTCWFCGDHLGEPASPPPDTVGRVAYAPGPGGASFSVTDQVACAYGGAPRDESSR